MLKTHVDGSLARETAPRECVVKDAQRGVERVAVVRQHSHHQLESFKTTKALTMLTLQQKLSKDLGEEK